MTVTRSNWKNVPRFPARPGVTRGVFSGKNCMMVLNEITPSAKPALHHHPHEQLTYMIKGKCKFILGKEVMNLAEGDLLLVPPDVPHSLEVTGNTPVVNLDVFSPIREDYLKASA